VRILLGIVIVLFLILWARAVIDVFRRHDLLILPFIGLLVYTMLRPANA